MMPMGAAVRRALSIAMLLSAISAAAPCSAADSEEGPEKGPIPFNKIAQDTGESLVVEGIGAFPLGRIPVAGYKAADFVRLVGEAAVEKEVLEQRAEIVLMNADAARLKRLVAAGEGNSAQAEAVKQRLRAHIDHLDSGDPGQIDHLLNVTARHFDYAVRRAGVQWTVKQAFKRVLKSDPFLRFWRQAMPLGKEAASVIGNRSLLRPWMQAAGWRRFGARAAAVERFVDRTTDAYLDALIANIMRKEIAEIAHGALERMYGAVLADHPPKPVLRQRVRRAIAIQPELYVPMSAMAAFAPQPAAPLPAAPAAAMPVAIAPRFADPVAQTIGNEARYLQADDWAVDSSGEDIYRPSPQPSPEPEPQPEPDPEPEPEVRTAREQELHEELKCVGAGNKPGCERWNISSDPKVEGNWDGRREGTVYDP